MKKMKNLETLRDNYQQASLRRERLYELLDMLETRELSDDEQKSACDQAQHLIDELKTEREQMALYMAQESFFVDEAQTRLREIMRVNKKRW